MKAFLLFILLCVPPLAQAELSCAQIGVVAEQTNKYRDDGYSLKEVLRELAKLEKTNQLTAEEIELLQRVAAKTFVREATPYEIVKECERPR